MDREQHLPYRATGDVIVLDGDGSRWVREGEAPCPSLAEGISAPVDEDGNAVLLMTMKTYDGEVYEREVREIPLDVLRHAKVLVVRGDGE